MRTFFQSLSAAWVQLKIRLKIRYAYPRRKKFRRIRSVIPSSLTIGDGIVVEENVLFSSTLREIGSHSYVGRGTYVGACTSIGKFTSISFDCKVGLVSHPLNYISSSPAFYAPRRGWVKDAKYNETENGLAEIGHDVLISANVIILAGVKVGHGAVVGAGAVVIDNIPPYAIVVGVPARVIKYRFTPELRERLLRSEWWECTADVLKKNADLAADPEQFLNAIGK
jgi:acetyltransferase-like isoleucine patch superfamily enzyme